MGNEKGSNLEQLREKVHAGLELLSNEESAVLFEDAEEITPQPQPTEPQLTQPQPSIAPTPVETTPPVVEATKGQANLLNLVPEKFRAEDEAASLNKMVKAMQEQEAELTRKSQELSQLQNVVQELAKSPRAEYRPIAPTQPTVQPVKVETPVEEPDDLGFLDQPVASTKTIVTKIINELVPEIVKQISVEQIKDYDTFATRRSTFEKFRADHSDFDQYKSEFAEACSLHPEWDRAIDGLSKLYDFAKVLAKARGGAAVTPTPAVTQPTPTIDIEKLKADIRAEVEASAVEKATQNLLAEIKRRRAVAGIVSSSPASTPAERSIIQPRTEPLTPEEKEFQDMVDSGPKVLRVLDPYGPSLTVERAAKQ